MTRTAGPLCHATLIVDAAAPLVVAYAALGLAVVADRQIDSARAAAWGQPALAGRRMVELAAAGAPTLLRLIEWPGVPLRPTRMSHGWMALEILVRDVDALAAAARAGGFEIVGEPADLEMSPNIRAMQLVGPAGEMLYLTQVKAPVPPFDLRLSATLPASQALGPLFIGVMAVPSRATAIAACGLLAPTSALQFETKVTVLNRAYGKPIESHWPVAALSLAGQCLFEIDEVAQPAQQTALVASGLPAGLAWLTLQAEGSARLFEVAPGVWLESVAAG